MEGLLHMRGLAYMKFSPNKTPDSIKWIVNVIVVVLHSYKGKEQSME